MRVWKEIWIFLWLLTTAVSFTPTPTYTISKSKCEYAESKILLRQAIRYFDDEVPSRRNFLTCISQKMAYTGLGFSFLSTSTQTPSAMAYDADPDQYRESLYLLSRIQEATCLQQRYIQKKNPPIMKMKLTLRLVDRSYRVLDQINYISKFIEGDDVVLAAQLGNEAAEALSDAIEFVNMYASKKQDASAMTTEQREFVENSLVETREKLFEFLEFVDQKKLEEARLRVEEENKLNQDEFDPDLANDAGVFNPIILPWKERSTKSSKLS